ncbi:MAG: type IV pilus modification PilV family protein [Candidatus Caldatribacteriaceae bacterium]
MSLIEVIVLFVALGFFIVAAAPLFSRFLATRASMDYTLRAALFAQDIMERVRGKPFTDLAGKAGSPLSLNEIQTFLYGSETLPPLPPGAGVSLEIQPENSDLLVIEVEIKWKEILRTATSTGSSNPQERSYQVATYVYSEGIHKLHRGSE